MRIQEIKKRRQIRRKFTIRKKVFGTQERLRLSIFRSLKHIYAQLIDDVSKKTVVAASTLDKEVLASYKPEMKKVDKSKLVGKILAKRAVDKNIKLVAFDRNGFLYHGRVKALADGAREGGLEF